MQTSIADDMLLNELETMTHSMRRPGARFQPYARCFAPTGEFLVPFPPDPVAPMMLSDYSTEMLGLLMLQHAVQGFVLVVGDVGRGDPFFDCAMALVCGRGFSAGITVDLEGNPRRVGSMRYRCDEVAKEFANMLPGRVAHLDARAEAQIADWMRRPSLVPILISASQPTLLENPLGRSQTLH